MTQEALAAALRTFERNDVTGEPVTYIPGDSAEDVAANLLPALSAAGLSIVSTEELEGLRQALESVTTRHKCAHGHTDVMHVAPFHFDGPACPECSDAAYADERQRIEPCVVCAALEGTKP